MMIDFWCWDQETDEVRPAKNSIYKRLEAFGRNRRVMETRFDDRAVRVSTIFLVVSHSFGKGPPLLFETMVFGGEHDGYQERYSTAEEAREGHKRAVAMVIEEKEKGDE